MHCGVQRATTLSLTCLALLGASLAPAAARASAIATAYTPGVPPGAGPGDLAPGPDGNLWFTESNAPGRIGRITPAGQVTEFAAGLTFNSQPAGITAGPDGAMWFSERLGARIGRIAADGTITQISPPARPPPARRRSL